MKFLYRAMLGGKKIKFCRVFFIYNKQILFERVKSVVYDDVNFKLCDDKHIYKMLNTFFFCLK